MDIYVIVMSDKIEEKEIGYASSIGKAMAMIISLARTGRFEDKEFSFHEAAPDFLKNNNGIELNCLKINDELIQFK